jgi:polyphosphate kinase
LLEDLISANLESLFPGERILDAYVFRVLRDADIEIRQLEAADLITTVEQSLKLRRFGDPVLLEAEERTPPTVLKFLMKMLNLDESDVLLTPGMLSLEDLAGLADLDKPTLRFPPHFPHASEQLSSAHSLFSIARRRDILVHHPYDSFRSVEAWVASATTDPNVVGIKQTMYRMGAESPIVESLLEAAGEGKQVAAMVELKARFDESNNLTWARELERAGVHVTFGFPDMKTHCKLCLVVRRDKGHLRTYAHIGTGNYNPATARIYTDLGLFTSDPAITQDIAELFNYLTGFSKQRVYRKLLVAPLNLREKIVERIRREILLHRQQGGGHLIFKANALVDPEVIEVLYDANDAGVQTDLLVRGVCCLRPGVPGLSENIRVMSVVGRFLEHSRVYYFHNGGKPEALIGSADLMRRNLDRRIEVLVPVEDPRLVRRLRDMLAVYLSDNIKAWVLREDGEYERRPNEGARFNAQEWLMANPPSREQYG